MKIMVISPKNKTVFNFRGDLIKDMIAKGNQVVVTGPNRDYVDDILALGVRAFIEVPLVKDNTSVLGDLRYYRLLKRKIKEEKPDLVFSYTIKPVVYGSMAAKAAGVKNIYAMITGLGRVYTSDSLKTRVIRLITKVLYKTAFRGCKKVIFQNQDDLKQFVDDEFLPKEKAVHVNGSGVNMERFKQTELPNEPVFLMVGRIIREKGVLEYCEAAREVKKDYPSVRFILLGGFDSSIGALQKEDIDGFIQDGSIEFPGEVKDPVPFYEACSVFVLPTYYREGLPRTILEAMACGRPVITTDWPGCRDAVLDGETGYLVEPKHTEKLTMRIKEMIENPDLISEMAKESYIRCCNTYDVRIVNESMREIIGW